MTTAGLVFIVFMLGMILSVISVVTTVMALQSSIFSRHGDTYTCVAVCTGLSGATFTIVSSAHLFEPIRVVAVITWIVAYLVAYGVAIRIATR